MRHHIGRRSLGAAGRTVVALGLVAAVSSCAAAEDTRTPEPAAGHTWNQTHRIDVPAGWVVTARNVGPVDESTSLAGPGSTGCLVSTSAAEPEPYWERSPRTISVQGYQGFYGNRDPDFGYPRQVVWHATDRWFGVSCNLDQDGILRLAAGVHAGTNPMRVPFRLRSVPDGVRMSQLIESVDGGSLHVAAQFEQPSSTRPLTMEVANRDRTSLGQGPVVTQTIGGHEAEVRRTSQTICLATRHEPICVVGPGDEPATDWSPDARQVAEATAAALVPVTDSNDQASWYDADDAFPS